MLAALGHGDIGSFHMNEGHSALLTVALLDSQVGNLLDGALPSDVEAVRARCVFTTHTPVPAGHDRFPEEIVRQVLGDPLADRLAELGCLGDGELNMTELGMTFSHYINAVALRHQQVSQAMFPQFRVASVTNGVHAGRWAALSIVASSTPTSPAGGGTTPACTTPRASPSRSPPGPRRRQGHPGRDGGSAHRGHPRSGRPHPRGGPPGDPVQALRPPAPSPTGCVTWSRRSARSRWSTPARPTPTTHRVRT